MDTATPDNPASAAGAALVRARWEKREPRTCPHCQQPFSGPPGQVYCRPAHQNAAGARRFRARHRKAPA